MAYYYPVCTTAYQPNFGEAATKHAIALNNYLVYGTATDEPGYPFDKKGNKLAEPLPKKKEVRHQSSMQTLQATNGMIYTTTILCCEDDE